MIVKNIFCDSWWFKILSWFFELFQVLHSTIQIPSYVFDPRFELSGTQSTSLRTKWHCFLLADWSSSSRARNCMFTMSAPGCKKSSSSTGVIINERMAKEMWETREREQEVGARGSETQNSYRNEYALGRPRGMVWGGRREEGSGWGTHVYLWWIHFDIWRN